jgi:hypothetical protein
MPGMHARPNAIYRKALDKGVAPTPLAVSRYTGIPYRTVKRALAGHGLSAETMALFSATLGATTDELFEPVTGDMPPPASLRGVK